jgi:hypothetical protein
VEHRPLACSACGYNLDDGEVVSCMARQVFDVPEVKATVTEHVVVRVRCGCAHHATGVFPPEATAPTCWGEHPPVGRTRRIGGVGRRSSISLDGIFVCSERAKNIPAMHSSMRCSQRSNMRGTIGIRSLMREQRIWVATSRRTGGNVTTTTITWPCAMDVEEGWRSSTCDLRVP